MERDAVKLFDSANRRSFIGGSDARVIMGDDETALLRSGGSLRTSTEPGTCATPAK